MHWISKDMGIQASVLRIEPALRDRKISVATICRDAGVSCSTWQRWRNGQVTARPSMWRRVLRAIAARAPDVAALAEQASGDSAVSDREAA